MHHIPPKENHSKSYFNEPPHGYFELLPRQVLAKINHINTPKTTTLFFNWKAALAFSLLAIIVFGYWLVPADKDLQSQNQYVFEIPAFDHEWLELIASELNENDLLLIQKNIWDKETIHQDAIDFLNEHEIDLYLLTL